MTAQGAAGSWRAVRITQTEAHETAAICEHMITFRICITSLIVTRSYVVLNPSSPSSTCASRPYTVWKNRLSDPMPSACIVNNCELSRTVPAMQNY